MVAAGTAEAGLSALATSSAEPPASANASVVARSIFHSVEECMVFLS